MSEVKFATEPFHCSICGGGRGYVFGYEFDPKVVNKFKEAKYVCKCRAEYEDLKAKQSKAFDAPLTRAQKDKLRYILKHKYRLREIEYAYTWLDDLDATAYAGKSKLK
jgi:hypothetical protein